MSPQHTVAALVRQHAIDRPREVAFFDAESGSATTWADYDRAANAVAHQLVDAGLTRGERIGVVLPDSALAHVGFVACERAGVIAVGTTAKAGDREIEHLLTRSGAAIVLTTNDEAHRFREPIVIDTQHTPTADPPPGDLARAFDAHEFSFLNSTSGTTGLPKLVKHNQQRWFAFHELAADAGDLSSGDVFLSALPAPFGFGLWTAHFTPVALGAPCVVASRFDPASMLSAIERHRVSVLAGVTTQLIMLLENPAFDRTDLSSLRVVFTGGEAVPYERAAAFEDRAGCAVLQFYGSNETGALSRTTLRDTREVRLTSAGHVIADVKVRLFDADLRDVTSTGGPAVPACKGAVNSLGYYDDDDANRQLYTADGWVLMGDLVTIDGDGVLRVVGRTSDFIIRGGKNISAPQVEAEVGTHPAVSMVAAVPMADPVYGERVCVYVVVRAGHDAPSLHDLTEHLAQRQVGKELWPEHLVVVDDLPRSSGGKVAKGELRADLARRSAGS